MAQRRKPAPRPRPTSSKPRAPRRKIPQKTRPARRKLDPRLAFLLSLTEQQRRALKKNDDARVDRVTKQIDEAVAALNQATDKERDKAVDRLRELHNQLFAPIS